MSQMNRGEAIRCIQIAKKCIKQNKLAKAEKFLNKSLRMYDTVEAKQLLASLTNPQTTPTATPSHLPTPTQNNNANTQSNPTPPQSPRPTLNRNTTANASTSSIGSTSRMSKEEEVAMVRQILRSKDFYKILGVPHDADEKQLKKAYRKKALKCHPDRNKAPGADEAFKKLSKAYDILRDAGKKEIYDKYGEDSPQMRQNGRGAQFQQMTPDDIIRMFFGGDFGGGQAHGFHFRSGFPQQRRRAQGEGNGEGAPMGHIMQLLPIILVFFTMILPSLMMFGGSSSSNTSSTSSSSSSYGSGSSGGLFGRSSHGGMQNVYFSLDQKHPFTLEKKTDRLKTSYFVQPSRRGTWGYQRHKSPRLEQEVENAYLTKLIGDCEEQRRKENDRIERIQSNQINHKTRQKLLKRLMKNKRKLEEWDNKQCNKLFQYVEEL